MRCIYEEIRFSRRSKDMMMDRIWTDRVVTVSVAVVAGVIVASFFAVKAILLVIALGFLALMAGFFKPINFQLPFKDRLCDKSVECSRVNLKERMVDHLRMMAEKKKDGTFSKKAEAVIDELEKED